MRSRLLSIVGHPWMYVVLGFFAAGCAVYGYSVAVNQFVEFDDTLLILDNISVIKAGRWSSVLWAFQYYDPELYIPLTFLSLQMNAVIGGLHPFIFHLDNLIEHIINALLIAGILQVLFRRMDIAILLGLLFLLHPLNTEAVAWASSRKDLLSSLFGFASFLVYLRYRDSGRVKLLRVSALLFLLGLLAKVSIVPLPVALLLCDFFRQGKISLRDVLEKRWFFIAAVLLGLIAVLGKDVVLERSSPVAIFLLIPRSITFYIEKFFLPVRLSIFYPFSEDAIHLANPEIILSALGLAAIAVGLWILRRRLPGVVLGLLIALLFLIPSFFQYYRGNEFYMATDRYMYMPFVGVLMAIASILVSLQDRFRRTMHWCSFVVLVICALLSLQRSFVWRNTGTLFYDALSTAESFLAYEKIGTWELRYGNTEQAIAALKRSIEISPNSAAYFRLGVAAMAEGDTQAASLFMQEALTLSPDYSDAHVNMSKLYWDEGNIPLAVEHAEKAVEFHAWDMMALGNLATMYTLTGRKDDALEVIAKIQDLEPDNERVKPLLKKLGR
ncbi:tetratricopeptide repeat protein [Candidatus Peregrinibacteria bacterium]|nr:tetratricopeptide repeat protein [Candidatus Peregrinibacteria bacterium]